MARGAPDYFGQSIYLGYGKALQDAGIATLLPGNSVELVKVNGKGTIYAVKLDITWNTYYASDTMDLDVDAAVLVSQRIGNLTDRSPFDVPLAVPYYEYFDLAALRATVMIKGPISYFSRFILSFSNNSGAFTLDVRGTVLYASVQ